MTQLYTILCVVGFLLALSVFASKAAVRLGVPTLLLFLGLGMAAGSEGIGGLWFDYPNVAQGVGVVALVYILFAAGFETNLSDLKQQLLPALSLATLGLFLSCALMAAFSRNVLGLTWAEGVLLGAVVSATDAAAVFSVLRAKGTNLRPRLQHLIEAETGSNDPMAVFLTFAAITAITNPHTSLTAHAIHFVVEMSIGAAVGYYGGKLIAFTINRVRLQFEGLYPVLSIALVILLYGLCSVIKGNGFLAVYVAGLMVGNTTLIHRRSLLMFHDGLAWLLQITMFLILGLQVFPSHLIAIAKSGIYVAVFLIFVARPLSVLVSLVPFGLTVREKLFVAWAGLRGAAPIILATIAVTSGVPRSNTLFDLVFFVTALSVAVQGTTVDRAAKWLGVLSPETVTRKFPLRYDPSALPDKQVVEFEIGANAAADNRRIVDLKLPRGVLVLLVARGGEDVVPNGGTILQRNDVVQVLADPEFAQRGREIFEGKKKS